MGDSGRGSPSVARALSVFEVEQLRATVGSLPPDWCLQIEPPYGQLSMGPLAGRRRYHRAWIASGAYNRIAHEDARA